jgi:hypothetical protein
MTEVDQRFFFIHVMKTAGGTLRQHLRTNYAPDQFYPLKQFEPDMHRANVRLDYLTSLPPHRRHRIRVFTGHFPFVAAELMGGGFITLTILRDPVERTLSFLRQYRRNHGGSLEEIYEDPILFPSLIHNHQAKLFAITAEDRPESYMDVLEVDAERLALAKANLDRVDAVGIQERFEEFLALLGERFGWRFGNVSDRNVTEKRADAPESLRRRIAGDNEADMEFYEHARELFGTRPKAMP